MKVELYNKVKSEMPVTGRHINACVDGEYIAVYQAYRKSIAEFAIKEQRLDGPDFNLNRMSWIKPSFLWMMFRSGWAQKEGQERVLQFWIPKAFFDKILSTTVISSFSEEYYPEHEQWKRELADSESRLQWDPDHDPLGKPLARKTIQLGLKGSLLKDFSSSSIRIDDITSFVKEQYRYVLDGDLSALKIPNESIYKPSDRTLAERIKLNN